MLRHEIVHVNILGQFAPLYVAWYFEDKLPNRVPVELNLAAILIANIPKDGKFDLRLPPKVLVYIFEAEDKRWSDIEELIEVGS